MKKNFIYKKLYFELFRIREIEKRISKEYKNMRMRCPVHLSIGQESIAVGVCQNLFKNDEIVTAHRSHAHYLAKGGNLKKMIAELYGKITGCAGGKGGSMHLIDLDANIVAAVPIVGSTIPIGVGRAWANKLNKKNNIVVIFFGDGATEEGIFFESLDFSILQNLRILFICENNNYSVYTHIKKRQNINRKIYKVANSLGLKSYKIHTHDIHDVYEKTKKAIKEMRKKPGPVFFEINTFRDIEHCGPNQDDYLNYRCAKDINFWRKKDQLYNSEKYILKNDLIKTKELNKIKNKIFNEIDRAFAFAKKSPYPKKKDLHKNIYKKLI